jgi:hypothetical protein
VSCAVTCAGSRVARWRGVEALTADEADARLDEPRGRAEPLGMGRNRTPGPDPGLTYRCDGHWSLMPRVFWLIAMIVLGTVPERSRLSSSSS